MVPWETLNRDARRVEEELETSLASLARFTHGHGILGRDPQSLMSAQRVADEADTLLKRLESLNESMRVAAEDTGGGSRMFQLARHKAILQDLKLEFQRLRSNLSAAKDTAELLAGASSGGDIESGSATQALLREKGMVASTSLALDGVLSQAQTVANGLAEQGKLIGGIGKKVMAAGARFPLMNGIMNAIRRRKSKDAIVLSVVVAVCVAFCIIYILTKRG